MSVSPFLDPSAPSLRADGRTYRRLELNHTRNLKQDHTELLQQAAVSFDYASCRDAYWNPEKFSLLYGTPVWDQSSPAQRVLLNQLFWVAYYSQIISAEIATIYYNQTCAAGLFGLEDFKLVCDTLDLESAQERAHIYAFKTVSEQVEHELFGERVFSYPMRGPFAETMVHADTDALRRRWKSLQLRSYGLLSTGSVFLACQYFTIRALRTLNGKIVQQQLGRVHAQAEQGKAPLPASISHYHFQDESFHFNSSLLLAQDVLCSLRSPTAFERMVANMAIDGCQRDHFHFSAAVNGIFWYEPAVYEPVYRVLRSRHFGMERQEALDMLERCFCKENEGVSEANRTHQEALESYRRLLQGMDYVSPKNRAMQRMARSDVAGYLANNRRAMARFRRAA